MKHQVKQLVKVGAGIAGTLLLFSTVVWTCPLCDSGTGHAVRAGVFGSDFATNLLFTMVPFLLFAIIGVVTYYGPPGEWRVRKHTPKRATTNYPSVSESGVSATSGVSTERNR